MEFALIVAASVLVPAGAMGAPPVGWVDLDQAPEACLALPEMVRPVEGRVLWLDVGAMARSLEVAPVWRADGPDHGAIGVRVGDSPAIIALPTPEGGVERFRFVECPVMPEAMQTKYPDVRTYIGQGIDHPASTVHFDLTPLGFHAQVFSPTPPGVRGAEADRAGAWYIDPISRGDVQHYTAYRFGDLPGVGPGECLTIDDRAVAGAGGGPLSPRGPTGDVPLHVLRLAVAATGEYTAFQSAPNTPNQAAGVAAVATSVNRINQIFMRDLAVQFMLAVNNDAMIFTDATTDPFVASPPGPGQPPRSWPNLAEMLAQVPGVVNATIAPGAWDVGHGVTATQTGTGFAGQGAIGGVCGPSAANAASTSGLPNGTYFWVSLLAHEIGHQLGGTHTFNGIAGTCGNANQYTPSSAIEPGSGTTIMSYAGNCGADNVVTHNTSPAGGGLPESGAVPMFNAYNIDQINQWLAMNFCGFGVQTGNHRPFAPAIGAGTWLVPANTPFRLNVTNSADPDAGQSTSISWEQFNLGAQRSLGPDTGANEPLFRTFGPSGDTERVLPVLSTVLGSAPVLGENLPRFDRTMFFRAVCRDDFAQGGGVTQSQVTVGVWRTPGDAPFRVTAPAAGASVCAGQILAVQWDPAGTADAPINAATVDITLSLDGGQTWPITLLAGAANSGQAVMPVPAVSTSRARVKVEPPNNIFFNVSPGDFSISAGPPSIATEPVDVSTCPGQTVSLNLTQGPNSGRIQWFRNGSPIPDANSPTLAFAPALSTHSDDYFATVTNGCGQVMTRIARLQVGVSVDSITGISTLPVAPCSPMVVHVQARGTGPLTYRWLRNGENMNDGAGVTGTTTATLSLGGARYALEGNYEVIVTEPCGPRRFFAGELRVAGPVWVQKGLTPAPGVVGQASAYWTMAYDESRGVTVMYGGLDDNGRQSNSLWEYDGVSWTVRYDGTLVPLAQPQQPGQTFFDGFPPPYYTACYSPDHQAVYLIVARGSTGPLRIWRWDGATWATVAERPSSGDVGGLLQAAYDRVRHRMVIVRVSANGGPAEVIEFDPTAGTFTSGPTAPQANGVLLYGSKMYYDETRAACVLYQPAGNFNPAQVYVYNGAWSTLAGVPLNMWFLSPMAYDPVRGQGVCAGGSELGPACGQWYTGTFTFPGSVARFLSQAPAATDWDVPLPDGAPRNPGGAGQSPDNALSTRMLAFDRRRNAMIAVGGRGMSAFSCGTSSWDSWERRYLDGPVFDVQPPAAPVPVGQVLTLSASPVGAATLSLRWRRNGVVLSDGPLSGFPGTTVAGATGATLTITGPGAAEAAAYRLEAVNGCGSVLSTPAIVGTLPPGDFNHDGAVSVQDIFDFLAAYFAGGPNADFNGSGEVTVQDIFDFLAAYFGG